MQTDTKTESEPQVRCRDGLGRWTLLYLLLALTDYNILFDWIFNRLGPDTIAWEGGVITAIIWVWMLKRPNS